MRRQCQAFSSVSQLDVDETESVAARARAQICARLNGPFEGAEWFAEIFYSAAIPFEFRTLFEVTGARRPIRTI